MERNPDNGEGGDGHRLQRRRWPYVVGAVAALLVVALAIAWFAWLPHYRPSLRTGERYGVDVSHHQGPIDWNDVAADDISFAYIKATEGGDFVDDRFAENWTEARNARLDRGAYHFFSLCASGDEQARNFLATLQPDAAELPPALDLELSDNCTTRPAPVLVKQEVAAFINSVESATGRRVIVYVLDDFEAAYPVREWFSQPLWIQRFLRRPGGDWSIWQVDSVAEIAGISGKIDLDVMRLDSNFEMDETPMPVPRAELGV